MNPTSVFLLKTSFTWWLTSELQTGYFIPALAPGVGMILFHFPMAKAFSADTLNFSPF